VNNSCLHDLTTESKVTSFESMEISNTCEVESAVIDGCEESTITSATNIERIPKYSLSTLKNYISLAGDSTLASKSKEMAPTNLKKLPKESMTVFINNARYSTSASKSNEKVQNKPTSMLRSNRNMIRIDSTTASNSNDRLPVEKKISSKSTERASKHSIPADSSNSSESYESVHKGSIIKLKKDDSFELGLNKIVKNIEGRNEQKSNNSFILPHLSKTVSFEPPMKNEYIKSNALPFGLYGLLFLDVEALLDGDTNFLQVTQLGCQTYFSNGELWSSFFSAVVPCNMAGYIKHSNPMFCKTLMSMLRMKFSNSKYQLVRPDSQSMDCDSYEQAKLKFSEYVMGIAELVDGIVFVINRPNLILDFLQPIILKSKQHTLGLINLTDVFSDSFPHSANPDDISSIHTLTFTQESLPSDMNCESKSKLVSKIIKKLLPCIDYENFIQPYGKIFPEIQQDPIPDALADELRFVESFSLKTKSIAKSYEYNTKNKIDITKTRLKEEKSVFHNAMTVDFPKVGPKLSAEDKSANVKADNTEVVGMKLEEYFESEKNSIKSIKTYPICKRAIGEIHELTEDDQDIIIPKNLNASVSEPQGNIDIDTDDENDNTEYGYRISTTSLSETRVSADLSALDHDVIVPTGPVCVCDLFTPSESLHSISGELSGLCKECRSYQVKIICEIVSPSKVKTIIAKIEDSDGIVSNKNVKFLPSPFLLQQQKPVPYSQVRKVFLDNYILLSTEGSPNMNLNLEKNSLIGLCQVWLGQKAEDLEDLDDVRLICEDIKILDDGTLVLLCSTELVLKRALPLMVSNISQYLHIKPEQRIVTASRTGMVSLTCKSGTTGYLPCLGDNVGTATTDVDDDLIKQMLQVSEQMKSRTCSVIKESEPKQLKLNQEVSPLATLKSIKAKNSLLTKSPLKFGVKKAFKASPLIRAKVFTAAANESSDDSTSPSPPPLATVEGGSTQKQKKLPDIVGASVPALCNNIKFKASEGKSLQPRINTASAAFLACTAGQQIPTIINRQTKNPSASSQAYSPPFINKALPSVVHTPPYKQVAPQSTQYSPYKTSAIVLPKPTPASCSRCIFQSFQSMKLLACNSCPYFQLVLTSDLALPPDKPTFAKVRFEQANLAQRPGVQLFAKVYTDNGVLKMPQSLNLLPSDNSTPIPKQFSEETVTVTFLNTVIQTVQLKAGQTVGRGQIIYIKK